MVVVVAICHGERYHQARVGHEGEAQEVTHQSTVTHRIITHQSALFTGEGASIGCTGNIALHEKR